MTTEISASPLLHTPAATPITTPAPNRTTTTLYPTATPLRIPRSAPPSGRGGENGGGEKREGQLCGPYPPFYLSARGDKLQLPHRVNPLAPHPPRRRINNSWETVDLHWHNDQRRMVMQQREHTRYHSAWAKAFYGTPADQEVYRRHFRLGLKQQMKEQEAAKLRQQREKVQESQRAMEHDRYCCNQDLNHRLAKFNYLKNFRDGNKQMMETHWQETRAERQEQNRHERAVLRYNPINWSATLK